MHRPDYEIAILCDGSDHNQTDRLRTLLCEFASRENLSVHIKVRRNPYITLHTKDHTYRFRRDALRYLTSDGHYCICHTTRGEHRIRISFRDAAAQLTSADPDLYWTVSRGILLARSHIVDHTSCAFRMDDGASFPVRRADRTRLFQQFDQH